MSLGDAEAVTSVPPQPGCDRPDATTFLFIFFQSYFMNFSLEVSVMKLEDDVMR